MSYKILVTSEKSALPLITERLSLQVINAVEESPVPPRRTTSKRHDKIFRWKKMNEFSNESPTKSNSTLENQATCV